MAGPSYFDWASTGRWNASAAGRVGGGSADVAPYSSLATLGTITQIGGGVLGTIGAIGAAEAQRGALQSQALSMEFENNISAINARAAERDAAAVLEAGRQETMFADLRAAAAKASDKVSFAARGVRVGAGSAAEVAASTEFARQLDRRTITLNSVRAANTAKLQAVNERVRGSVAAASARNLRASAKSIQPWMAGVGGLLGSVGAVASHWAADQRSAAYYRGGR